MSGKKLTVTSYTLNSAIVVPLGTINDPPSGSNFTKVTTDNIDNKIYQNSSLKQIQTSEGYSQGGVYYYYLKDHLGNTRVIINSSGTIIEKSHYYPFGMRFYPESSSNSNAIAFRYNGKEYDSMNGLNHYDYGARFYDPAIGRWSTPDPLAEEEGQEVASPYCYVENNPISRNDPDGRIWNFVIGGAIGATIDAGLQSIEIAMDDNKSFSKDFSWGSVGVFAVAGATGVGLAAKIEKLGVVAKILIEGAHDMAASAANQAVKEGKVSAKDVVIDATIGKIIGDGAGKITKNVASKSSEVKLLTKQLDRIQRVAGDNPRPSRVANVDQAQKKINNYIGNRAAAASVSSSNVASTAAKKLLDDKDKKK